MRIGTPGLRRFASRVLPTADMQEMRRIVQALSRKANEIYNLKKSAFDKGDEAVLRQIGEGKDILSVLSESRMSIASSLDILIHIGSESQHGS